MDACFIMQRAPIIVNTRSSDKLAVPWLRKYAGTRFNMLAGPVDLPSGTSYRRLHVSSGVEWRIVTPAGTANARLKQGNR